MRRQQRRDVYQCDYCGFQECPSEDHFQFEGRGTFCSPECEAGYSAYRAGGAGNVICAQRHAAIEAKYGRRVICAPPPKVLSKMKRSDWLALCRQELSPQDRAKIDRETQPQATAGIKMS